MTGVKPKFSGRDLKAPERASAILHKIGHEIGNPLTSIISIATLLERATEFPPEVLRDKLGNYGRNIGSEAWRVAALNEKMVLLFSERTGLSESVELREVVDRALRLAEKKLHREVNATISGDVTAKAVADRELATWAVYALIENAVLFGNGENVSVEIQANQSTSSVRVTNSSEHMAVDLAELYEPFVVVNQQLKRTGLGLTVAASIIDRLGGEIAIEHSAETAPRFMATISLPRSQERTVSQSNEVRTDRAGIAQETRRSIEELKGPLAVAVIEDEAMVGSAIKKILGIAFQSRTGLEVELCTGEQFLERLTSGARFRVVLCDMNLGTMLGEQVLEQVRKAAPELTKHFAFLTGDRISQQSRELLAQQGIAFLQKPFEADELIRLVVKLATAG